MNTKEIATSCLIVGEVFTLPKDHVLKDENGNVINTTKIVLEKKKNEYPKTYEECCRTIGFCFSTLKWDNPFRINRGTHPYIKHLDNLMESFYKLLVCRDAYWKIAGEKLGLGEPWKPDWTNEHQEKHIIGSWLGTIQSLEENFLSHPFAFPTEEMRDDFKKNFDPEIEICKELL